MEPDILRSHCSSTGNSGIQQMFSVSFKSSAYCQVDNANEEVSNKLPGRH